MNPYMHHRYILRLGLAALLLAQGGCFLKPKKKSGSAAIGDNDALIDRTSIVMDRIGDGDAARLQFTTVRDSTCQMAYWSQDPDVQPTKDNPTVVPCSSPGTFRSTFTEQITGLATDSLYFVLITAWTAGSDVIHGDVVTVRETPSTGTTSTDGAADVFSQLMVARFDLPLLTAEIHRNILTAPADIPTIKGQLTRQIGCTQGVPAKDAGFRDAAKDVGITNLATQDLAAGTAAPSIDYPERLQITYGSLNNGIDKWTLLYQAKGKDFLIPATPISRILNMDMESAQILNFDAPQLATAPDPLKIDVTKPLKLAWTTTGNLLDLSYLSVQIGRPDYEKGIYCIWPANKFTGVIDAKYLANLDDGTHVVLAELASNEIWAKDGWLITTYDWRSGQIEK